jgi:hypothetical protein
MGHPGEAPGASRVRAGLARSFSAGAGSRGALPEERPLRRLLRAFPGGVASSTGNKGWNPSLEIEVSPIGM